jgi:hypothetical protein
MIGRTLLIVALAMTALPAGAQTPAVPSQFQAARSATIDLAVPESPGFAALGLTPQDVTRPTSGRELATSFLNGVDRDGNLQTGIAIDVAPYMLLAGSKLTLQKYRNGPYLTRFLAQWQTSFATAKGAADEDKSVKLAFGMRFTFFDKGDPRMDDALLACLAKVADFVSDSALPVPPGSDLDLVNRQREEAVREGAKPCREDAAKRRWNRSAWIAGLAPTWMSPEGKAGKMEYTGTVFWTSIGHGFEGVPMLEDHAMAVAYFKTRDQEIAPDPFKEGSTITQDAFAAGGRFIFGAPATQVNVEAVYLRNDRKDNVEDRYWRMTFGLERRLVDNIWAAFSIGRELDRRESDNALYVLSSFKWGFGEK